MVKWLWATLGLGFGAVIILTTGCRRRSVDGTDQMGAAKNACMMGVGSSRRVSSVRWGVAQKILIAWMLTLPASAVLAVFALWLLRGAGMSE